jgi:hypothetical protein
MPAYTYSVTVTISDLESDPCTDGHPNGYPCADRLAYVYATKPNPIFDSIAKSLADLDSTPATGRVHRSRGSGTPDQRVSMDRAQGGG